MFDSQSGKNRAGNYQSLMWFLPSNIERYFILYALLSHKGTVLRQKICTAIGFISSDDEKNIASSLNFIKNKIEIELKKQNKQWDAGVEKIIKDIQKYTEKKRDTPGKGFDEIKSELSQFVEPGPKLEQ